MTSTIVPSGLPAVSPEVLAFAAERGVAAYFPAVLEMTRSTFPTSRLAVSVEADAEEETDRYVLFEVDVTGLELSQLNAARQRWARELSQHCPTTHTAAFRIGLV
jgi:hypothetical protein